MALVDWNSFKNSCETKSERPPMSEGSQPYIYEASTDPSTQEVFERERFVFTENGIKIKLLQNKICIGYGKIHSNTEKRNNLRLIEKYFLDKNFLVEKPRKRNDGNQDVRIKVNQDPIVCFWDIVSNVEKIHGIAPDRSYTRVRKYFDQKTCRENLFEKIAHRFKFFFENKDGYGLENSRSLLSSDSIDDLIKKGESLKKTQKNKYREHVVPCVMIYNEALKMTASGKQISHIADMIQKHLAIIEISNEEAIELNTKFKTVMPPRWEFGDNIFARLDTVGIKYKLYAAD
jgi:hypothetical protein